MTLLLRMFTGKNLDVLSLETSDIDIVDIAHSLAMQPRFGGHAAFHYSVAQHSIVVAQRMHELFGDYQRTLKALLHDASEAYLIDVPRPIKYTPAFEVYRSLERKIQRTIDKAFGLDPETDVTLAHVDHEAQVIEGTTLFTPPLRITSMSNLNPSWSFKPAEWTPRTSEETFLVYFQALAAQRALPSYHHLSR